MSNKFKNILLILIVAVIFIFRVMEHDAFNPVFYLGCMVMACIEALYLFINRRDLEDNDRITELFYLAGIGIVVACKLFIF